MSMGGGLTMKYFCGWNNTIKDQFRREYLIQVRPVLSGDGRTRMKSEIKTRTAERERFRVQ